VGGGVHLGPLGKAATDWPIVRAPGDYDDGVIGRRGGKPATNRVSYGAAHPKFIWNLLYLCTSCAPG
jgi:hypothetical protein